MGMGFFRFDNGFCNEIENTLWVIILIGFRYGDYCNLYNSPCCRERKGRSRQKLDQNRAQIEPSLKPENTILIDTTQVDNMIYK